MHEESEHQLKVLESWRSYLTHGTQQLPEDVPLAAKLVHVLASGLFRILPSDPRCKVCGSPFHGPGGVLTRTMGFRQSNLNPRLCNRCDEMVKMHEGGAEVELAMLFADVRGSTSLAEKLGAARFSQLINRFYRESTHVLIESDALIDKLIGDEVAALYVPGIAGQDYARRAVEAAQELLRATGHADPDGPWIPVGAGVHTGIAYVGAVGSRDGVTDITALGDTVNTAARLASSAGPGEILVSEDTLSLAGLKSEQWESRHLELKGRSEPIDVRVVRV